MFWKERHLSDQDLVLTTDEEPSRRRLARAHKHLAGCPSCRIRLEAIHRTLADLSHTSRERVRPLPPADWSRAQLKRRLAQVSTQSQADWIARQAGGSLIMRRWMYGLGVVVLSASGLFLYARSVPSAPAPTSAQSGVFLRPITELTPGATRPVTFNEICGSNQYVHTNPIPVSVHQHVFNSYRADYRRAAEYELDYLITPELGGIDDARNLWPQPFSHTPWNAYVKDELERLFHRLVCDGQIELATAQWQIASDWISAYKQYFKTDKPLRDYTQRPLTALDSDLVRAELQELGLSPPSVVSDGSVLLAMLWDGRQNSIRRLVAVEEAKH